MSNDNTHSDKPAAAYPWRFFRAGGFDQVRLDSGADLLALDTLDQKLWVALSCPTRGLEFDGATLDLIDTDRDGHIRAPELIAALKWAGGLLKDPDALINSADGLRLAAIDDASEDGRRLLASARRILHNLGKDGSETISAADTGDTARIFAQTRFNGDGIVPPEASDDPALQLKIAEIIDCMGAETDRCGAPGLSLDKAQQFFESARAYLAWQSQPESDTALLPLGEATARAAAAVEALAAKAEDYFVRCRLVAYDAHAAPALNGSEADFLALARRSLNAASEDIAALPLAAIGPKGVLPLERGINPAWQEAVAALRNDAVLPLLGNRTELSEDGWIQLKAHLGPYRAWLAAKAESPAEKLGTARLHEVLGGGDEHAILDLIARDQELAAEADAIAEVDRLVRYCRDLATFANNFVSFRDFYTRRAKAVFQAGTLYLDGRSCELCLPVEDAAKHAMLATLSGIYLAYCDCTRGADRITIVAAFTAGDAGLLMVGRNGVFYDRAGRDWNATVTKLVEHPISVSQAFWSPYRKLGRLIGEQLQKFAAAKAKAVEEKSAVLVAGAAQKAETSKPAAPAPFDVGKFAGIFAAMGLAVGAIGTALASVVTGLFGLKGWQLPLALAGLMLAVSGPSMLIAWFKLRTRNLGPLLDANGWAVNARAKINIPFGSALTHLAKLPSGAERSLTDPYAEKRKPWAWYLAIAILVALALFFTR